MEYEQKPSSGPTLIRIDIDPAQMEIFQPDLGLIGDSAAVCRALHDQLQGRVKQPDPVRLDEIATAKETVWQALQKVLSVIREALPRDGFYVSELSQMGFTMWAAFLSMRHAPTSTGAIKGRLASAFLLH